MEKFKSGQDSRDKEKHTGVHVLHSKPFHVDLVRLKCYIPMMDMLSSFYEMGQTFFNLNKLKVLIRPLNSGYLLAKCQ